MEKNNVIKRGNLQIEGVANQIEFLNSIKTSFHSHLGGDINMKRIYQLSVLYLLLPNICFLLFWLRSPLNIIFTALLVWGVYFLTKKELDNFKEAISRKDLIKIFILSLVCTIFSGVGGISFQMDDWTFHNSKFYMLYKQDWPIFVENKEYLAYYFGYYIVPGGLCKLIGFYPLVLFIWTFIGLYIGLFWFYEIFSKKASLVFGLLMFGGLSLRWQNVFKYLFQKELFVFPFSRILNLGEQLSMVVNQIIPAFILVGIFIYLIKRKQAYVLLGSLLIPIASSFIWAPFVTISFCLVLIIYIVSTQSFSINQLIRWSYPIVFVGMLPILLYLFSNNTKAKIEFLPSVIGRDLNLFSFGFSLYFDWIFLFSLLAIISAKRNIGVEKIRFFYGSLFILIMVSCLFKIGVCNDWLQRISIVYLLIIGSFLTLYLQKIGLQLQFKKIIFLLMFLPMIGYLLNYTYAKVYYIVTGKLYFTNKEFPAKSYSRFENVYLLLKNDSSEIEASQYLGNKKSFFYQHLIKKSD